MKTTVSPLGIQGANGIVSYMCPHCGKCAKTLLPGEYDEPRPRVCPHCGKKITYKTNTR